VRILFASFVPDSRATGMGAWTHLMADALAAEGHAVSLWFEEDFPAVRRLGRGAFLGYPVALAARIARRAASFDVVVVHEPAGLWYALLRRARRSLPPLVAMCHNVEAKVFGVMRIAARRGLADLSRWSRWSTPHLRLPQSQGALRLADQVVCLSREDEEFLMRFTGVARARLTSLVNGAAPPAAPPGRPAPGHRVLFVGGWLDIKGRRLLPPLFSALRGALPDATLTVAGVRADAARVRAEFATGDRRAVAVVPSVAGAGEMASLYASHDALLLPSLSEGSPLVLLEALAAGLPAVAADVGGVPDIVAGERGALLFRPMRAEEAVTQLVRLLSEPALAARLSATGRARAAELTWERAARALLEAAARAQA
jgi:glycosyltransferase involved in cell wall biosynthesis